MSRVLGWVRRHRWILAGVGMLAVLIGNRGFWTMVERHREIARLERQFRELRQESKRLAQEIVQAEGDPAYLERIARRELGLIRPGEVEYRFLPPTPSGGSASDRW